MDVVSAELVDNGSTVIARATMAADIPERVSSGSLDYRFYLDFGAGSSRPGSKLATCRVKLSVGSRGRTAEGCGFVPRAVGYTVRGATLEIPVSKTLWPEEQAVSWHMRARWRGPDEEEDKIYGEPVNLDESSDRDLSSRSETVAGNIFEVFHYPSIHTNTDYMLPYIYERVPPDDELALLFTDFRYDDLFNSGPGSGPLSVPIQGIGDWQANPRSGSTHGSDSLLSAAAAQYIGGPKYNESGVKDAYDFHGHARGVNHAAHELLHRWAANLRFRDPRSGGIESLTDDWCQCHWSEWLHLPERYPVWSGFSNRPFTTVSVMGGRIWQDNGDGTFTEQDRGYPWVEGLSDLDLYVMGMIPPEEVRPTFLLRDVVETGTRGVVRATKVPVRIEDIIAAMGPRVPSASEQRRVFRLGVYLLHEDGRPPRPEWLARARSFTDSVAKYFTLATGGHVDANRAPVATGVLPDRRLTRGGTVDVDLSQAFSDPDGDVLRYTASSSAPRVATALATGSRVRLTAVGAGAATIRVTATDPGGLGASRSFGVTVRSSATGSSFTDHPIVPGVTPIRAVHFTELRERIDALRAAAGLARFSWTDPLLVPGATPVRLVHLLELRRALAAAYAAAGRAAPVWTDGTPARGPIRAAHLMQLRAAVLALE